MRRVLPPLAVAMVAFAGCGTDKPADPTVAAATTGPASTAPTSAGPPPSSPAPTTVASSAGGGGCPVDAATLQKAFQANAKVAGAIVLGKGFKDISCYQGYATALTQPENVDTAVVVFKYDTAKKSWVALAGGTDNVCAASVPAAVRSHLRHC